MQNVKTSYEYLLREFHGIESTGWLAGIRNKLEGELEKRENELRDSEFEGRLKELDKQCWNRFDGGHLYEIRFEIYTQADEQLKAEPYLSDFSNVPVVIEKIENAIGNAKDKINTLLSLDTDREAFRLQEAKNLSNNILCCAEHGHIYSIVKRGVSLSPNSVKNLEELIQRQSGREYHPESTADVFRSWKSIRDAITELTNPEQRNYLNDKYAKLDSIYGQYIKRYLTHWLEEYTEQKISSMILSEKNWQAQHKQIEKLDVYDIFSDLSNFGKYIEMEVLKRVKNYVPQKEERIIQFRENLKKLTDVFFRQKCVRTLSNWSDLSDNSLKARDSLLNQNPSSFQKGYVPFSCHSSAEFVDMYWYKLTYESLRLLVVQFQHEGTEAFKKLVRYGNKFPLKKDAAESLSFAELADAHSLLNRILVSDGYSPKTIGSGDDTGLGRIDIELKRLRKLPLPSTSQKWLNSVKRVIQGFPEGMDSYYCKVILLKATKAKGEKLLADVFREFEVVQGNERSGRYRTMSAKDVVLEPPFRYPGQLVRIQFYQYPGDLKPIKHVDAPGPWACLKMLLECSDKNKPRGYIKLGEKQGLPGVFWLKLEFCRERDGSNVIDFPKVEEWPPLKGK